MENSAHPRTPLTKWINYPNLRRRPHAPNKGRGRLQRQIRRAFIAHGNEASASDIYRWCRRWQSEQFGQWERWSIVRILETIAVRVRKLPPNQAWLWRLRNSYLPADASQVVDIAKEKQDAD